MHTKLLSGGYGEYAYKGVGKLHYEPRRAAWLRNPATEFRFIIRTSAFAQYDNDATYSHKPNPKPNSESHTKRWSGQCTWALVSGVGSTKTAPPPPWFTCTQYSESDESWQPAAVAGGTHRRWGTKHVRWSAIKEQGRSQGCLTQRRAAQRLPYEQSWRRH